jgi:hypothetical protein
VRADDDDRSQRAPAIRRQERLMREVIGAIPETRSGAKGQSSLAPVTVKQMAGR